jgi:hypothetical protein
MMVARLSSTFTLLLSRLPAEEPNPLPSNCKKPPVVGEVKEITVSGKVAERGIRIAEIDEQGICTSF